MNAPNTKTWMIYGANGYTGELIAREAARRGWQPILAGRNAAKIEALGRELGLPTRIFDLDHPPQIVAALAEVDTVLHCAGPFTHTSAPMVQACLNTGSHYLDITGEIDVFEAIMPQTEAARSAGVSLIPGVGFDVAPTDCLAAQLAAALPDATDLQMAFYTRGGGFSRGTAKTGIEHAARGNMVRRAGKLVAEPLGKTMREVPFSLGPRMTISIPWGDVSTAWYTTGIPNIRVYMRASQSNVAIQLYLRRFSALFSQWLLKRLAQWIIGHTMSGPSLATRENARVYLWGQVRNAAGDSVSATFDTPEGYSLTVTAALAAVERVLSGEIPPGSWTPARAFGADFGQQLAGVTALEIQRSAK